VWKGFVRRKVKKDRERGIEIGIGVGFFNGNIITNKEEVT
jgi:hypothetical protein